MADGEHRLLAIDFPDGSVAVVSATERTGRPQTTLLAVDPAGGGVVGEVGPFAPAGAPWLAGTSDAAGFRRPFLWQSRTGPVEIEWLDSGHLGDFGDAERAIAHMARFLHFAKGIVGGHGEGATGPAGR